MYSVTFRHRLQRPHGVLLCFGIEVATNTQFLYVIIVMITFVKVVLSPCRVTTVRWTLFQQHWPTLAAHTALCATTLQHFYTCYTFILCGIFLKTFLLAIGRTA